MCWKSIEEVQNRNISLIFSTNTEKLPDIKTNKLTEIKKQKIKKHQFGNYSDSDHINIHILHLLTDICLKQLTASVLSGYNLQGQFTIR